MAVGVEGEKVSCSSWIAWTFLPLSTSCVSDTELEVSLVEGAKPDHGVYYKRDFNQAIIAINVNANHEKVV